MNCGNCKHWGKPNLNDILLHRCERGRTVSEVSGGMRFHGRFGVYTSRESSCPRWEQKPTPLTWYMRLVNKVFQRNENV